MINFSSFSFSYPDSPLPVLRRVNLEIASNSLTLVIGASGSGKSTLLRCINGLVPHFTGGSASGKIDVLGSDPIQDGPGKMAQKIGFVFQEPEAQFVFEQVEDEIVFPLENMGIPRSLMQNRLDQALDRMEISHLRKRKINQISGGEQQMVAIASALVSQPPILILDEPTSQLDPSSADNLLKYIVSLKQKFGLTVLVSEHRLERLLPYCDTIVYLTQDHHCLHGPVHAMLEKLPDVPPVVEIARQFNISPLPVSIDQFSLPPNETIPPVVEKNNSVPPSQKETLLKIDQLSTRINGREIIHDVTLDLYKGEILTLLGPKGSGKTTLLRSILGLIPSSGERQINNTSLESIPLSDIIQHIAYLPQNPNDLLFAESVLDELKVTLNNHGVQKNDDELKAILQSFELEEKMARYPRDLSVGERQRTALAAISVHEPQILLLDEPTRGLDYSAKQKLGEIINNWTSQGKAILLVTHDVEFAVKLADRVVILENGKIAFKGIPGEAFRLFPGYQTQTALLFPKQGWITAEDVINNIH